MAMSESLGRAGQPSQHIALDPDSPPRVVLDALGDFGSVALEVRVAPAVVVRSEAQVELRSGRVTADDIGRICEVARPWGEEATLWIAVGPGCRFTVDAMVPTDFPPIGYPGERLTLHLAWAALDRERVQAWTQCVELSGRRFAGLGVVMTEQA